MNVWLKANDPLDHNIIIIPTRTNHSKVLTLIYLISGAINLNWSFTARVKKFSKCRFLRVIFTYFEQLHGQIAGNDVLIFIYFVHVYFIDELRMFLITIFLNVECLSPENGCRHVIRCTSYFL